jgi:hypothetical protein
MSRNINVNPAHYKVAGRERQGEAINQELQRQQFTEQQAANERWQARQQNATPWEHAPAPSAEPDTPKRSRRPKRTRRAGPKRRPARRAPKRAAATNRRAVTAKSKTRKRGAARRPRQTRATSKRR